MSKSVTTTSKRASGTTLSPIHPGEVLSEDFLKPMGLSSNALAARIDVPGNRISMIVAGKRSITGDTALRLAAAFATTPDFWMNLQKDWELAVAKDEIEADLLGMRVA